MSYEKEAMAIDAEILGVIEAWRERGDAISDADFNDLALRLFDFQRRHNEPYARYCAALGVTSALKSWEEIPAVPVAAFKEAAVATFPVERAALVFETSGTTRGAGGLHYMESAALYDAALLAGFDRFALRDGAQLRYLNLLPNPAERPRSSLGYMMARVAEARGDGRTGWYVRGDALLVESFERDLRAAIAERQPVCIAATAFAAADLLEALAARGARFALPAGSRIMETGGFKGRRRAVDRGELYAALSSALGIGAGEIVAEYGMTELTSQYYARAGGPFAGPPWLRTRVVGPERTTLPWSIAGSLLHVDLANRSSCVALQTDDAGMQTEDGLVLLGRQTDAPPRGCSLDAEQLVR
ncbi:MAG TPA: acyl-protein synthetase [Candidatus Binatia bacterium]|nr:acyl-protein synthetase [Candidatus Binatia bacterium]